MQPVAELAVGTLKLDGTSDAITKEQAAALLPLWEVYKEIGTSDTAAQQEIDALTAQIQAAMTEAQLQSISAMKLTQEDVMELVRQQVPSMSAGSTNGGGPGFGNGGPPMAVRPGDSREAICRPSLRGPWRRSAWRSSDQWYAASQR